MIETQFAMNCNESCNDSALEVASETGEGKQIDPSTAIDPDAFNVYLIPTCAVYD